MSLSLWSLPRNDVAAALDYYRRAKAAGELDDATVRVLARLQDDPTFFFQAIKQL
jgi:hypothetical protein